jgi:hypothetical protein
MAGRYARTTTVSVAQSRAELETVLERYGADQFAYSTEAGMAQVGFRIRGLYVRLRVPMPLKDAREFALTPTGRIASEGARLDAWEQACRQRWRALVLVVKAKLEAAEVGISTLEREFLADTLLPDGRTVADAIVPQIADSYLTGKMPPLLAGAID